jgi:hypothetical protein
MRPPGLKTAALLDQARKARSAPAVTQAAIFVVTENAPYEALCAWDSGTPKVRSREREAVRAMMLLERLGVPLNGKALWDQRLGLARAVIHAPTAPPPDVAEWCERVVNAAAAETGSDTKLGRRGRPRRAAPHCDLKHMVPIPHFLIRGPALHCARSVALEAGAGYAAYLPGGRI